MLKADANGLPINATNTDSDVADAVAKKHAQNTDTGTSAANFAINGNNAIKEGDARLSDARTPLAHNQAIGTITTAVTNLIEGNGSTLADSGIAPADVSDAVSKRHTQNTDTGTTAQTFGIDTGSILGNWLFSSVHGAGNFRLTFQNATLTADRTLTYPNVTDQIAVLGDIVAAGGMTHSQVMSRCFMQV